MKKSFIFQLALVGASLLILIYVSFANRDTKVLPTKVTVPFADNDVRVFVSKDAVKPATGGKKTKRAAPEPQAGDEPDQGSGTGTETDYNATAETVYNSTPDAPAPPPAPVATPNKG